MRINASRIETDEQGFAALARIHAAIEQEPAGDVLVDCSRLQWVDANMCAPLAAAIIASERRIRIQKLNSSIAAVLQKNGFLGDVLEDTHGTTIRYQQFDPTGRA